MSCTCAVELRCGLLLISLAGRLYKDVFLGSVAQKVQHHQLTFFGNTEYLNVGIKLFFVSQTSDSHISSVLGSNFYFCPFDRFSGRQLGQISQSPSRKPRPHFYFYPSLSAQLFLVFPLMTIDILCCVEVFLLWHHFVLRFFNCKWTCFLFSS